MYFIKINVNSLELEPIPKIKILNSRSDKELYLTYFPPQKFQKFHSNLSHSKFVIFLSSFENSTPIR